MRVDVCDRRAREVDLELIPGEDGRLDSSRVRPDGVVRREFRSVGGLTELETQHERLLHKGPDKVSAFTIPKLIANSASGQVSIQWGLRGPNECIVTACASAANSIGKGSLPF